MGKEEKSLESPGREHKLQELQAALDAKDLKEAMQKAQELEQDHLSRVQEEAIEDFQKVGREQSETFGFLDNFLYGSAYCCIF
jgi:small-conductance mechanosensitive channel